MNRKGSRPTFESNPDESIWDKQKRCIDTNGELVAELEAHTKPNEVRELLAGLMVFNFKLLQFDKFLADLKASSGGGQVQTFTNPGKLSACYDKVLAKLGEILFTFRDQKKKNRLKRLFGSVNLRKEFDQTHALLQQYSRELLELHLKEIEAEKDRQALLNKQQTIPVPPRPGTKPAPAISSPTGRPGPARPPPRPTKPHPGAAKTLPAPIQPDKPPTPHSSPTTMRPAPSAKPAVKIGQRGTLVLKSAPLAARIDIEKMFWSQFKMGFQVPWDDFERRFIKLLSMPSLPAADSKLMRHILDSSATGFITFPKYDEFVKGFGPLKLCLRNIKRLFSRDWWHGFLSGEETDYLLEGSPPGSFLGRMSISNPGSFALAVVNKDNTVKHFLVKSVTNQDGLDFGRGVYLPLKGERSVAFPDLVSLVESKDYSRVFQTPLSCDFIKESFFHGVLDREEAEELLKRKPVGTFLVRFSSTQKPHLAVSWIAEGNVITHRLFERKGGKYWNGPSGFATLKETVASCPELKVACENTRAEMYAIMQEVPLSEIPSVAPSPGVEIDASKGKQQSSKPAIETSTNYGDFSDMDLAMASAGAAKAGGATRDNQYISFGGIGGDEGEKETEVSRYVEEDFYSLAGGGGGSGGGGGGDAYGMYDEGGSGQDVEEEDEDEEGLFSIMEALKARAETKKK